MNYVLLILGSSMFHFSNSVIGMFSIIMGILQSLLSLCSCHCLWLSKCDKSCSYQFSYVYCWFYIIVFLLLLKMSSKRFHNDFTLKIVIVETESLGNEEQIFIVGRMTTISYFPINNQQYLGTIIKEDTPKWMNLCHVLWLSYVCTGIAYHISGTSTKGRRRLLKSPQ